METEKKKKQEVEDVMVRGYIPPHIRKLLVEREKQEAKKK